MEEEDTIIIQVIFKFEDGRLYNFDVDRTTTFNEMKKILSNAAHILKNSFTLYHEGQEYSKDYDDQPLLKIFPTLKKIEFYLKLKKTQEELDENELDQISVKYNIKQPCKEHIGKFLVLYCISCKKSICNECFSLGHNNHEVEEKADYLMPAKILMERIFANTFMFKSDPKLSNYMSCVSFRSIIKTEIFDRLRQLISELENKCINCLEFFSFNEDSTEKNNDLNLELLKKYCTSSFIKLKNNIDTKEILINDEVFLSLYNKLKAIRDYETSLFTENANKYKALNQFFLPFTQEIKNMSIDLNNILIRYINKDIYAKFKEDISKNIVDVVQKEDVIRFMFENVNLPKSGSSLAKPDENMNKNSLTPNYTQRLLPSILLFNESKNNNINNRTNIAGNINVSTVSHTKTIISNTNINPINNSINFQQVKENFTISSPIHFSKTNNNNVNTNMNITNNTNMCNVNSNINNNINTNIVSINNMNNHNMNSINCKNNNVNSINSMNTNMNGNMNTNMNGNVNTNMNGNMNTNINGNVNGNITTNKSTNMNINSNLNTNMNSNMNTTATMTNNMNTNTNMNSNMSTSSNINVNTNINPNMNPNMNNSMSNFLLVQNVTSECNHEATTSKEEKEKEKSKTEKTEKMDVEDTGETPPTQNSPNTKSNDINYSQTKIEEIKANLTNKNSTLYTSPIIKKALISVHLSPTKKDDNSDNKSAILSNTFIQQRNFTMQNDSKGKNIMDISNTVKNRIETNTYKNSINKASIFSGKLIDVLNKEKNSSVSGDIISEKKEDNEGSCGSPNFANKIISSTENSNINESSNINEKYFSQKIENTQLNFNLTTPSPKNISVSFMYPVFKTNIIKGAIDKNTVQEIKINFSEFSNEDPIITEFPNGGAYCNYENCLYFTGGQEYIKEAGKLFLSINKNSLVQNATKLPLMKNYHWNHSMIADKDKIYVIGGYNSNKCEYYDITNKTWNDMPDLTAKERQRTMLFIENNYLYCFMGLSQTGILETVERINLEKIESGWESIIVDNCGDINLKFYGAGIIRMNQTNKIFFIGGKKENKKKETVYKRSIYEFSFDDYKMTVSDFKIENDLAFVENKLYPMDDNDCGNFINLGNGFLISMPNLVK